MGSLWSGYDPRLDRKVAIKLVPVRAQDEVALDEARALARVSGPHAFEL